MVPSIYFTQHATVPKADLTMRPPPIPIHFTIADLISAVPEKQCSHFISKQSATALEAALEGLESLCSASLHQYSQTISSWVSCFYVTACNRDWWWLHQLVVACSFGNLNPTCYFHSHLLILVLFYFLKLDNFYISQLKILKITIET